MKYLLLLPLVFGMLAYTSLEIEQEEIEIDKINSLTEIIKVNDIENLSKKEERRIFKRLKSLSENSTNWELYVKDKNSTMKFIPSTDDSYISGPNGERIQAKLAIDSKLKSSEASEFSELLEKMERSKSDLEHYSKLSEYNALALSKQNTIKQMNQLVEERNRLLKSSNELNPIIVNLDVQLKRLRESINKSKLAVEVIEKRDLGKQYALLLKERERLLQSSNEMNPKIVDLNAQLEKLRKEIYQNDENVPFAKVDEVPVFPGCEEEGNKRACFNNMIQKHIAKNFNYPLEEQEKGIQGRVSVLFIISKKGKIEGLRMRGPDSLLENEVARIIEKLPRMKPGRHKGKKVDVSFSIPISFKLEREDTFEKLTLDTNQFGSETSTKTNQYNQLVNERQRLLKSSNEKNPIIVNLDEQLNKIRESLSNSLKNSVDNFPSSSNKSNSVAVGVEKRGAEEQYVLLMQERERLLISSNEKNPIIVNLDAQLEKLKKSIDQNDEDVPFATVDEVPVFPGCEDGENKRSCFNEMMQKHISKNFNYPLEAQQKGIQGRVSIMFTVSEDGTIQNVRMRGPDVILEKEAARIISLLPKMTPGKQKGKAVNVPFSIPITFQLQNESDKSEPPSLWIKGDNSKNPLVLIDGKESTRAELSMISPNDIATMNVLKGDTANNLYGEKGKNGILVVTTKNHLNSDSEKVISDMISEDSLIIIDGKESTKENMNKIEKDDIATMNVFKDDSAIKKYGNKGKNGVIEITTKKKN